MKFGSASMSLKQNSGTSASSTEVPTQTRVSVGFHSRLSFLYPAARATFPSAISVTTGVRVNQFYNYFRRQAVKLRSIKFQATFSALKEKGVKPVPIILGKTRTLTRQCQRKISYFPILPATPKQSPGLRNVPVVCSTSENSLSAPSIYSVSLTFFYFPFQPFLFFVK